jgi:cell division protein FtsL
MKRRRKRGIVFYVLVSAASAGAAALAHVWVRMQVVQAGYEIAREKRSVEELTQANQRLRIEIDGLKAPARIEAMAKRDLKMVSLDPTRLRRLSGTLGVHAEGRRPALAER